MTAMRAALIVAAVFFAVIARAESARGLFSERARFDAAGCPACHRIGGRGGESGPDLTLVGVRRPRSWIESWLKSPHAWKPDTKMPEQGLSDADRGALAEFLSGQKGQAWAGARPWTALPGGEMGRAIYIHAGCIACHGVAGRGGHPNPGAHGDVIPALAPLMGTYTADELKAKIKSGVVPDGRDGMTPAVVMPAWKDVLSEDELDELTQYLLSLAESQPKSDW
jgi:mono/diheme cytochrome c family protein